MGEKPTILTVHSEDIAKGRFFIGKTKNQIDGGVLEAENTDILFCGTDNPADTFFGWGILRSIVSAGEQAVMMFSKKQKYKLPTQREENE